MKKFLLPFFAFIFIACSSNTPVPTLTAIPPTTTVTHVVESPTALLTFTAVVAKTSTAFPTFAPLVETVTPLPTFTPNPNIFPTLELLPTPIPPTAQPTRTPLPETLPKFPLDGYVILFAKNGDLYFQDGINSPIKLDHVGEVSYDSYKSYKISDDNQKVALGIGYSINTDGTQKKQILPNGWWDQQLWGTKIDSVEFVPGTHQILFRTYLCTSFDNLDTCVSSIYLTDPDTGETKKLADLGFSGVFSGLYQHEIFKISPNGKMVAITTTNSVDIINMEGKIIRHDILPFKPNTPDILFPSVFWLPDSSGLIVTLPNILFEGYSPYNYLSASTIWRYTISNNIAVQILFDPPPMDDTFQVSPDGKWIVYGGFGGGTEVYLGNLENGQTQIFGTSVQASFSWSPDSKHFRVSSAGSVIGSIGAPILRDANNCFGWFDGNYLSCPITQDNINKSVIAEIVSDGLKYYDLGFDEDVRIVLIKPK